jgi:hypothetical protein
MIYLLKVGRYLKESMKVDQFIFKIFVYFRRFSTLFYVMLIVILLQI